MNTYKLRSTVNVNICRRKQGNRSSPSEWRFGKHRFIASGL